MITVQTREEFLTLLSAYMPEHCMGVEIGVLHGDFSKLILQVLQPNLLVLIDPYIISEGTYGPELNNLPFSYSNEDDYRGVADRFKNEMSIGKVMIDKRYSFDAVKDFPDGVLDFLYLDADHIYEATKRDLNDWLPKIKKDGIIAGHDHIEFPPFGVIEAVYEFCEEHGFEMIIFNENGGDFALKKKA